MSHVDWVRFLSRAVDLPDGLCGDHAEHPPHVHDSGSLGRFWCCANQMRRLPAAAERAWRPR